jgi:hypothetical protein
MIVPKLRLKKLEELREAISQRADNPGMNPDFDGIFSRVMDNNYISEGRGYSFEESITQQSAEEKKRNAVKKFTNYAFYDLMDGKYNPDKINVTQLDSELTERINKEAFSTREDSENSLRKIGRRYGVNIPVEILGDTSKTDWYLAQDQIASTIMYHFGVFEE